MPSFSVAPGSFPPAVPEDFPDFLRWQDEGAYLESSRTIDTVNLTGGGIVSVDSNGTTLTITLGSPPSIKLPGWMTDIIDSESTPLHANSGYGSRDFIAPPGVPYVSEMYAGIEDYAGETIVWTPIWEPTFSDPSPTVTPGGGGTVHVHLAGDHEGLLTLAATVDGTPSGNTIEMACGAGQYANLSWQPTP